MRAMTSTAPKPLKPLVDRYDRTITYLRLSVTDRCDLRCNYCMAERMTFLPKRDLLSLEELERLADAFIARGVRKIRITGGEPLVRRDIMSLLRQLGRHLNSGALDELTITTNGTTLARYADDLMDIGVRRVNISLDTLDRVTFAKVTRRDALNDVLAGIDSAQRAGLSVKVNTVALKDVNQYEIPSMIEWAHRRNIALTLIEVMPLGDVSEDRFDQYLPLTKIKDGLKRRWRLSPLPLTTGGPAQYARIEETGGVVGFITPLTNNFCANCNRVRVTCTGQIYMCLGHADRIDLRSALRGQNSEAALQLALDRAMMQKAKRHAFEIEKPNASPSLERHMSVTGG
ncbi:MAG: GTP 3',8-cyclase MoaA [Pseudomonadota bacterium]